MSNWGIVQCPYCKNDMKKGVVECDGRSGLIWVEQNKKRNIISKITNSDCIVLGETNFMIKTRVQANYCDVCKKIVIDII